VHLHARAAHHEPQLQARVARGGLVCEAVGHTSERKRGKQAEGYLGVGSWCRPQAQGLSLPVWCCSPLHLSPALTAHHLPCSLVLRRLQMALPMKLHELLTQLDYKPDAGQAE